MMEGTLLNLSFEETIDTQIEREKYYTSLISENFLLRDKLAEIEKEYEVRASKFLSEIEELKRRMEERDKKLEGVAFKVLEKLPTNIKSLITRLDKLEMEQRNNFKLIEEIKEQIQADEMSTDESSNSDSSETKEFDDFTLSELNEILLKYDISINKALNLNQARKLIKECMKHIKVKVAKKVVREFMKGSEFKRIYGICITKSKQKDLESFFKSL